MERDCNFDRLYDLLDRMEGQNGRCFPRDQLQAAFPLAPARDAGEPTDEELWRAYVDAPGTGAVGLRAVYRLNRERGMVSMDGLDDAFSHALSANEPIRNHVAEYLRSLGILVLP